MKKLIFILLAVLSLFIFRIAHAYIQDLNAIKEQERLEMAQIEAEMAHEEYINSLSVPELIGYISPQYGADPYLITKITWCESKHKALPHDRGLGFGVTGYHKTTFEWHKEIFNRPDLRYESTFDQIAMMSIAFEAGEKYRRLWTTYVAYMNGGEYSFYSRTLQGHYTARCS